MTRQQWTTRDIARHFGVAESTVRKYASNGPGVSPFMPAPDGRLGATPWWWDKTIRDWEAERPGRGARTDLKVQTDG